MNAARTNPTAFVSSNIGVRSLLGSDTITSQSTYPETSGRGSPCINQYAC